MVFSSITFLFYFLPVFLLAYLIFRSHRNFILLFFSLIFYAWGEPVYILLMLFSISCNYCCARWIGNAGSAAKERFFLVLGISGNLVLLLFFKYFDFVIQQIESLVHIQFHLHPLFRGIPLPLGISFFTFQAMSYLIDVYRKHVDYEKSFLNVATYITMFPQLVAGPIVRFETIVHELHLRQLTYDSWISGLKLFTLGLASKVMLANTFSIYADDVFSHNPVDLSVGAAWLGAVCYTFQIYFDFAGYSTMAIGLGKMLGFNFPENFNTPYIAESVTDFWRRWHISLSTWFRDYLYIPLGGNKNGTAKTYRNLMIVFVLCGLWHGASWNFLVWGMFHGSFLILERFFRDRNIRVPRPLRHVYLVLVIMVGWILFRSPDLSYAVEYIQIMFKVDTGYNYYAIDISTLPLLLGVIAVGAAASACQKKHLDQISALIRNDLLITKALKYCVYALLFITSTLLLVVGQHNPFIYFRF